MTYPDIPRNFSEAARHHGTSRNNGHHTGRQHEHDSAEVASLRGAALIESVADFIREQQKRRVTADAEAAGGRSRTRASKPAGASRSSAGSARNQQTTTTGSRRNTKASQNFRGSTRRNTAANFDPQALADNLNELLSTGQVEAKSPSPTSTKASSKTSRNRDKAPVEPNTLENEVQSSLGYSGIHRAKKSAAVEAQSGRGVSAQGPGKGRSGKGKTRSSGKDRQRGRRKESTAGGHQAEQEPSVMHSTANLPPCTFYFGLPTSASPRAGPCTPEGTSDGPETMQGRDMSPDPVNRTAAMMSRLRSPFTSPFQTRTGSRSPSPFHGRVKGWFTPASKKATPEITPQRSPREHLPPGDQVAEPCSSRPRSPLLSAVERLKHKVQEMNIPGPQRANNRSPSPYQRNCAGVGTTRTTSRDLPDDGFTLVPDPKESKAPNGLNIRSRSPSPFRRIQVPAARSGAPPKFATAEQIMSALHDKLRLRAASGPSSAAAHYHESPQESAPGTPAKSNSTPSDEVEAPEQSPEPVLPEGLLVDKTPVDSHEPWQPIQLSSSPPGTATATPRRPPMEHECQTEEQPFVLRFATAVPEWDGICADMEPNSSSSSVLIPSYEIPMAIDRITDDQQRLCSSPGLATVPEQSPIVPTDLAVPEDSTDVLPSGSASPDNGPVVTSVPEDPLHMTASPSLKPPLVPVVLPALKISEIKPEQPPACTRVVSPCSSLGNSRSNTPRSKKSRLKIVRSPTVSPRIDSHPVAIASAPSSPFPEGGGNKMCESMCERGIEPDLDEDGDTIRSLELFGFPLPPGTQQQCSDNLLTEAKNSFLRMVAMIAPGVSQDNKESPSGHQNHTDDICVCEGLSPRVSVDRPQEQEQPHQHQQQQSPALRQTVSLPTDFDSSLSLLRDDSCSTPPSGSGDGMPPKSPSASMRYERTRESVSDLLLQTDSASGRSAGSVALPPHLRFALPDECKLLGGMGRTEPSGMSSSDEADDDRKYGDNKAPQGLGSSCLGLQHGPAPCDVAPSSVGVSLAGVGVDVLRAAGWWNCWAGRSSIILDAGLEVGRVLLFSAAMVNIHFKRSDSGLKSTMTAAENWMSIVLRLPHLILAPSMAAMVRQAAITVALAEWQKRVRREAIQGFRQRCSPLGSPCWEEAGSIQSDTALARFPVVSAISPGSPASPVTISRRQQRKEQSPRPVLLSREDLVAAAEALTRRQAGLTAPPRSSGRTLIPNMMPYASRGNSSPAKNAKTPREILKGMTKALRKGASGGSSTYRDQSGGGGGGNQHKRHGPKEGAGTLGPMAEMALHMEHQKAAVMYTKQGLGAHSAGPYAQPMRFQGTSATPYVGATYRPVPSVIASNKNRPDLAVEVTALVDARMAANKAQQVYQLRHKMEARSPTSPVATTRAGPEGSPHRLQQQQNTAVMPMMASPQHHWTTSNGRSVPKVPSATARAERRVYGGADGNITM